MTSHRWSWFIIVASTFTVMAGSAVAPALPALRDAFAGNVASDVFVAGVPGLSAAATVVGALFVARFIRRFGTASVLSVSLVAVALTGAAGAAAPNLGVLLISRCLLGIAVAGVMTSTTTWIGNHLQGIQRDRVTGRHGVAMEVAGVVFFSAAGFLAHLSWRAPFFLYLAALPMGLMTLKLPRGPKRIDDSQDPPHSPEIASGPPIGPSLIGAFVGMLIFGTWTIELPFFVIHHLEATSVQTGMTLAVATAGAAISGAFFPRFKAIFALERLRLLSLGAMSIAMLLVLPQMTLSLLFCVMFLAGLGFGLVMPVAIDSINQLTDRHDRGRYQSRLTSAAFGGQVAAGALTAMVGAFGQHGHHALFVGIGITGLATYVALSSRELKSLGALLAPPPRSKPTVVTQEI